jgi:hypothetical protein
MAAVERTEFTESFGRAALNLVFALSEIESLCNDQNLASRETIPVTPKELNQISRVAFQELVQRHHKRLTARLGDSFVPLLVSEFMQVRELCQDPERRQGRR